MNKFIWTILILTFSVNLFFTFKIINNKNKFDKIEKSDVSFTNYQFESSTILQKPFEVVQVTAPGSVKILHGIISKNQYQDVDFEVYSMTTFPQHEKVYYVETKGERNWGYGPKGLKAGTRIVLFIRGKKNHLLEVEK